LLIFSTLDRLRFRIQFALRPERFPKSVGEIVAILKIVAAVLVGFGKQSDLEKRSDGGGKNQRLLTSSPTLKSMKSVAARLHPAARPRHQFAGSRFKMIRYPVLASRNKFCYDSDIVNLLDQHYLWASLVWGTIAGGYLLYGWKQRVMIPFVAGLVMTVASIFIASALLMSLASVAIMFAVWWLLKQGY
jgi:hypothetical protein